MPGRGGPSRNSAGQCPRCHSVPGVQEREGSPSGRDRAGRTAEALGEEGGSCLWVPRRRAQAPRPPLSAAAERGERRKAPARTVRERRAPPRGERRGRRRRAAFGAERAGRATAVPDGRSRSRCWEPGGKGPPSASAGLWGLLGFGEGYLLLPSKREASLWDSGGKYGLF